MTIRAIARITEVGIDLNAGNYNIGFTGECTDDSVVHPINGLSQIPITTTDINAVSAVKDDISAKMLADFGWVIASIDIVTPT